MTEHLFFSIVVYYLKYVWYPTNSTSIIITRLMWNEFIFPPQILSGWIVYNLFISLPGTLGGSAVFFEISFYPDLVTRVFLPILNPNKITFLCYEYSGYFIFIIT